MKHTNVDGYNLIIGQNKEENEILLDRKNVFHTWFHVKDFPSAHLWVDEDYNNLSKAQIYKCAIELKKRGKFKKYNNIEIIYALGKDIENEKSTVYPHKYKTIKV